jgi:hypothetical protein
MKQVFVAQHPTEAHLVKGALAAEGIAAEVQGESLFSVRGEAPATADTLPTVWVVDDADAPRAEAILAAHGRRVAEPAADAPWLCPQCKEMVEFQFTECWRCGTSQPESAASE